MKCTAYSRAERSSPADGVSSCKQSPRLSLSSAAPLKNTPFWVCFFNLCKVCLHKFVRFISKIARGACRLRSAIENTLCSHRLLLPSAALWFILSQEPVVCARRLRILRALIAFSCRLNYPAKLHATTACRFLRAFRTPLQKLCRRVRRLRSRLPLASNFSLFTCRHQLYGLFCHRSLSAAVLFVLVFQLEDIVDFLLIHSPYGFIVQFLMINTGNGGSFVQL